MTSADLFFILTILCHFFQTNENEILRKDYYESLSPSKDCLELSHYYPSGPLFLHFKVVYEASTYIPDKKIEYQNTNIFFKKIDNHCANSIKFATQFEYLKKINLKISLYLENYIDLFGEIEYNFYEGILPDKYILWDRNEHFSIYVEILNGIQNEFLTDNYMQNDLESYVNSISKKRGDLCLITDYTNVVILRPEYGNFIPDGLVTRFIVHFYQNGEEQEDDKLHFSAFECDNTFEYPDTPTILIRDRPIVDIKFTVVATKVIKKNKIKNIYELKLPSSQSLHIDYMDTIPKEYKKVFIVNIRANYVKCKDGSRRLTFRCNNKVLYVKELKDVLLLQNVEHKMYISYSSEDRC